MLVRDINGNPEFVILPADLVANQTARREKEAMQNRARQARYRATHPEYGSGNASRTSQREGERKLKPFVMWDGEGPKDAGYALFGNSKGDEICHPFLSSLECLELILDAGRKYGNKVIHFWFGGNYDASMILNDLPIRHLRSIRKRKYCVWRGMRIEHVPHKWFSVADSKTKVTIFDVHSYFNTKFVTALEKFKVTEDLEMLRRMKAARSEFLFEDIDEIRLYWLEELRTGVKLMDNLRKIFNDAGFNPQSWHGPGGLARIALNKHNISKAMAKSPPEVLEVAKKAFAGGRFEMIRGGYIETPIYNADLRSAYPAFCRNLPNLANGEWRYTRKFAADRFGIWHIAYKATHKKGDSPGRIYPLFRRTKTGYVDWPDEVNGWYHTPEAALVEFDSDATILEGWEFVEYDPNDKPFAWIEDYYKKRAILKGLGNPAEFTFKLIINSIYGQLAQRAGWDERKGKAPRYHQLEWAGYITSACRAEIYKTARLCGDSLLSIDTDGIYAKSPVPVCPSSDLGGWELSVYAAGMLWQSGIYILRNEDGDWERGKAKTRGIPAGNLTFKVLHESMLANEPITLTRNTFTGYGLAIQGRRDKMNTWNQESFTFYFGGGSLGSGKRIHLKTQCNKYCDGEVHTFRPNPTLAGLDYESYSHFLPWEHAEMPEAKLHKDLVIYDANHLDSDDRWVLEY